MLHFSKTVFALLIAVFALLPAVGAEAKPDDGTARLSDKAENIRLKIEKNETKVRGLKKKESSVIDKLGKIDRELNKTKRKADSIKKEIDALDRKISETESIRGNLAERIHNRESYASERVVALYKLNRLGKMNLLASADSITDFFHNKNALERIVARDEIALNDLGNDKTRQDAILSELRKKKADKAELETAFEKQVKKMAQKKRTRKDLLRIIRREKSLTLASIESLKAAATALDKKIASLKAKSEKPKPGKTTSSASPSCGFPALKGTLDMPVMGKIVSNYGAYVNTEFNVKNFRSGIKISAKKGEPIHAVHKGKVLFSDWFKGYGNMLIIDHGDSYYTLYAHADKVFKSKGDNVESGEVIATVGDTGSMKGTQLHFEVRHHGKPMDPMKWLKKG